MSNSNYSDVIEAIKMMRVSDEFMNLPEPCIVTFDTFFNIAIKALEKRPTGCWVTVTSDNGDHSECNKCHEYALSYSGLHMQFLSAFCPHCGARMKAENDHL